MYFCIQVFNKLNMSIVIAITNNKGGVGKTTSTLNIGGALSMLGKKVLLIDLDTQANLSSCFGLTTSQENHVGNFILKEVEFKDVVVKGDEMDLIPSSKFLIESEEKIASKTRREDMLKFRLNSIKEQYDYVIIDCPPNLGLLTINAVFASDYYIAPIEAGTFSYLGIGELINKMNELNEFGAGIKLLGIMIIKYHEKMRDTMKKTIISSIKESLGVNVFMNYIRVDGNLDKSQLKKMSIFKYSPTSNAATDYHNITNEILGKL